MRNFTNILFLILAYSISTSAQITGLWEVNQVQVGDQIKTPTAKWFNFNSNNDLESGNGGVINIEGTWSLDENQLLFKNPKGVADPYGAFNMEIEKEKMTWSREEDGRQVIVHLSKSSKKPKAPWDMAIGYWMLEKVYRGDVDVTSHYNPDNDRFIFLHWDRKFSSNFLMDKKEDHRGFWHIESHFPYLRLFSEKGDIYDTNWDIAFVDGKMVWTNQIEKEKWLFHLRED